MTAPPGPEPPLGPARRARTYRKRRRAGQRVLRVVIDHHLVVDFLIAEGRLTEAEALDDAQVARAVGRVVAEAPRPRR